MSASITGDTPTPAVLQPGMCVYCNLFQHETTLSPCCSNRVCTRCVFQRSICARCYTLPFRASARYLPQPCIYQITPFSIRRDKQAFALLREIVHCNHSEAKQKQLIKQLALYIVIPAGLNSQNANIFRTKISAELLSVIQSRVNLKPSKQALEISLDTAAFFPNQSTRVATTTCLSRCRDPKLRKDAELYGPAGTHGQVIDIHHIHFFCPKCFNTQNLLDLWAKLKLSLNPVQPSLVNSNPFPTIRFYNIADAYEAASTLIQTAEFIQNELPGVIQLVEQTKTSAAQLSLLEVLWKLFMMCGKLFLMNHVDLATCVKIAHSYLPELSLLNRSTQVLSFLAKSESKQSEFVSMYEQVFQNWRKMYTTLSKVYGNRLWRNTHMLEPEETETNYAYYDRVTEQYPILKDIGAMYHAVRCSKNYSVLLQKINDATRTIRPHNTLEITPVSCGNPLLTPNNKFLIPDTVISRVDNTSIEISMTMMNYLKTVYPSFADKTDEKDTHFIVESVLSERGLTSVDDRKLIVNQITAFKDLLRTQSKQTVDVLKKFGQRPMDGQVFNHISDRHMALAIMYGVVKHFWHESVSLIFPASIQLKETAIKQVCMTKPPPESKLSFDTQGESDPHAGNNDDGGLEAIPLLFDSLFGSDSIKMETGVRKRKQDSASAADSTQSSASSSPVLEGPKLKRQKSDLAVVSSSSSSSSST